MDPTKSKATTVELNASRESSARTYFISPSDDQEEKSFRSQFAPSTILTEAREAKEQKNLGPIPTTFFLNRSDQNTPRVTGFEADILLRNTR